MKKYYFISCFLLYTIHGFSQNRYTFETLLKNDQSKFDFPQDIIRSKDGFVWITTKNELRRYDGKEIETFTPKSVYSFYQILENKQGILWLGTYENGIIQFNPTTQRFKKFYNSRCIPLKSENGNLVFLDYTNGKILEINPTKNIIRLIYTFPKNVTITPFANNENKLTVQLQETTSVFDLRTLKTEKVLDYSELKGFPEFEYFITKSGSFFEINNSYYTVFSGGILEIPKSKTEKLNFFVLKNAKKQKIEFTVYCKSPNNYPVFYLTGLSEGIFQFNANTKQFTKIIDIQEKLDYGKAMYLDVENNFWITSSMFDVRKYTHENSFFNKIKVPLLDTTKFANTLIASFFAQASNNKLWFRGLNGVYEIDKNTKETTFLGITFGGYTNSHASIASVAPFDNVWVNRSGEIWEVATTTKNKKQIVLPQNFSKYDVTHIVTFQNKFIITLLSMGEYKYLIYDTENNTYTEIPFKIKAALAQFFKWQNKFWILTKSKHLISFTNKNDVVFHNEITKNGSVLHIIPDETEKDILWATTFGYGLLKYNIKTKSFKQYKLGNGLPHTVIYGGMMDREHNLWISTMNGLSKFDTKKEIFYNYSVEKDGLGDTDFDEFSFFTSKTGEMYFGGVNNVTYFNPENLRKIPNFTKPYLRNFYHNSKKVNIEQCPNFEIESKDNTIQFDLGCLDMYSNGRNVFQYFLEGYSNNWQTTEDPKISFINLPYKKYNLKFRVADKYGRWVNYNKPITFEIVPSFWSRPIIMLIIVLATLLGVVMLSLFLYRRLYVLPQKLQWQLKLTEQNALQMQMNPHFIYNALNSINSFILNQKPFEASNYLSIFSKLMRAILANNKSYLISLESEIKTLKNYIALEEIRLSGRFKTIYVIDKKIDIEEESIPPFLLQPFIENSIWHGLSLLPATVEGILKIIIKREGQFLRIDIDDNGIGRAKSAEIRENRTEVHKSYGLDIIHQRINLIKQIYKLEIFYEIFDKIEDNIAIGTTVSIWIEQE